MKITAQQALDLAIAFREAAKSVGDYLYDQWNDLPKADRERLRSMDVTLMNVSTDLVIHAVGISLDEGQVSIDALTETTAEANGAIQKIDEVKKMIGVAAALIGLAAALPAGSMQSIASAFQTLQKAVA
jgi:hypothetical protein